MTIFVTCKAVAFCYICKTTRSVCIRQEVIDVLSISFPQ